MAGRVLCLNRAPVLAFVLSLAAGCGGEKQHTVGGTVSGLLGSGLVLQNRGGDNVSVSSDGHFAFATPIEDGVAYEVTVLTQPSLPSQVCTVVDGKGTVDGADVTNVSVQCAARAARYVLVVDDTDESVSTYVVDAASGRIKYIGKVATGTGTSPVAVAVDPAGQYAYVANSGDGTIGQYKVGADGSLTAMTTSTVDAGTGPRSVAVDPSGRYVYVVNGTSNDVYSYSIGSEGALTETGQVAAGVNPRSISVDPSCRFAYVANDDGTVSQYTIGANGALAQMDPATVPAGTNPASVSVDPTGRYVYVANAGGNTVSQYTIGSNGALSAMGTAPTGANPHSITVGPSGKYAYVVNSGDGAVSQYSIGPNGTLLELGTAVPAASGAEAIVLDLGGQRAYVANAADLSVSLYTIGANGVLAANAPSTVPAQVHPTAIAVVTGARAVEPVTRYIYVTNRGGTVSRYTTDENGALTNLGSPAAVSDPAFAASDPSGRYLYVTDKLNDSVLQYNIGAAGNLSPVGTAIATDTSPSFIAVHPNGRYLYIASASNSSVWEYSIGADGSLTKAAAITAGQPSSIVIAPSGRHAYVANGPLNRFVYYSIGTDGHLQAVDFVQTDNPRSLALDPSGRFLYVANETAGRVSQYLIHEDGSAQLMTPAFVASGYSLVNIVVDPFGRYVYVANADAPELWQYVIGADGALQAMSPNQVAAGTSALSMPSFVAVAPSGRSVYVTNGSDAGGVFQYSAAEAGALSPMSPFTVDSGSQSSSIVAIGGYQ